LEYFVIYYIGFFENEKFLIRFNVKVSLKIAN
jgi:hypothetical protein